jgi:class 3 adenylate cyclase/tetratricopeptide (TPR) repeat protein
MRCAACAAELLPGKRFCHACGAPAPRRCDGCGAALEAEFRFCPDCGRPVQTNGGDAAPPPPPAAGEGERRHVTVLFCDLVGSTALAERLDPEEFHDLLETYLGVAFPEVYRFEGVVNQLAGDGLMAIFGAPVAHEDDPQRAVRAALAVRDAVHGLADRLAADGGPQLTVRIGIHTGPVVVGSFGNDLKADYTAIGDTTNVAARLQSLADPGAILMTDATERLVRGFFDVRDAGMHEIRGKREHVRVWQVLGRHVTATAMSVAAARGLTVLTGREAEIGRLLACYERLGRGEAQFVTVVGASGSGKSRLVYELRARLRDDPPTVFEAYSSSMSRDVPYHPIMTMMRRYFGLEAGDGPQVAREKIERCLDVDSRILERSYPRLMALLSLPVEHRRAAQGEAVRRETFEAVARLVMGASQRRPVIVVLEDVHWIDVPSRELLGDLLARLQRSRVMVIATMRPETDLGWHTRAARTRIELGPLAADDVRAMVRAIVGAAVPRELEDRIVAKATGSPFFAEELTRALLEEGHVVVDDGRARLTRPIEDLPLPGTVQEVIAARLDRLGSAERRTLQVASVLGREFRADELATLLADEPVDVESALEVLERRGLLHRKLAKEAGELRFGESLTQEVAYEALLLRQRRELHGRVAALVADRPGDGGPQRSALRAHHLARSDDRDGALAAMLEAARDAEGVPSYLTAAGFYAEAGRIADQLLGERPGEPALERAALEGHAGLARLVVLFGLPMIEDAGASAARGRALAEALGDVETLSSLLYFEGILTLSQPGGDFNAGLAMAEEAVTLAERAGVPLQVSRLRRGLAINYALDGRFDEALAISGAAVDELERSETLEAPSDLYLTCRWVHAFVLFASDALDAAAAHGRATLAACERVGNRTIQCIVANMLAQIHLLRGEFDESIRLADRALEVGETIGNLNALPAAAAMAVVARRALGKPIDHDRYLDVIERGLGPGGLVQMNFRFVAEAYVALGQAETGLARLDAAARVGGGRLRRTLVASSRGDLLCALGRRGEAAAAYDDAIAIAESVEAGSLLVEAVAGRLRVGSVAPEIAARALAHARRLGLVRHLPMLADASEGEERAGA